MIDWLPPKWSWEIRFLWQPKRYFVCVWNNRQHYARDGDTLEPLLEQVKEDFTGGQMDLG